MSFSTDWDVYKYYDETEPESHWELRREFMEMNKTKYPEDSLVSMAQVLYNAEFLGCVYNPELMKRVYALAGDLVKRHREKRKAKLQRTFVSAKHAAENKAKRKTDPAAPTGDKKSRNN